MNRMTSPTTALTASARSETTTYCSDVGHFIRSPLSEITQNSTSVIIWREKHGKSMEKNKKRLLPIVGIAVSIVMLRQLRKRGLNTTEAESIEEAQEEPKTAAEHAAIATEHARLAAEKAAPKRGED